VVGAPWRTADGRLLNCAVVLADGTVRGVVPKTAHPNYGEFYERRWFVSGAGVDERSSDPPSAASGSAVSSCSPWADAHFAIEICEDLWAPEPPGIRHCLAGADVILNLSASNELVAKADYRRELVRMTSARGLCGYLYASSGPMESTKDVVYGGHLLACGERPALGESDRFAFAGADPDHRVRRPAPAPRPHAEHHVRQRPAAAAYHRVAALSGMRGRWPA
jgi:NAD+ synthase (glutamine-hydrolysing)